MPRSCIGFVLACATLAPGCYAGSEQPRPFELHSAEEAFPGQSGEPARGWFGVDGDYSELDYQVIDGLAIADGDIILGLVDELSAEEQGLREPPRSAVRPNKQWKNAVVPYKLHPSLGEYARKDVLAAMNHWEQHTRIRFVKRKQQEDFVVIVPGDGCASAVGREGGKQYLTLNEACGFGAAVHELGHAVGLLHEQMRTYCDDHVTIHWNHIVDGYETNFMKYTAKPWKAAGYKGANIGAYDFGSIMHYGSDAFANEKGPSITKRNGDVFEEQRDGLSKGDKKGVAFLYGPPGPNDQPIPHDPDEPADDDGDDDGADDVPQAGDDGTTPPDHACWVAQLYGDVLGRAADETGLQEWVAAIDNGVGPGEVAGGFVRSEEALTGFVSGLYTTLLRREPDAGGLAEWKTAMLGGKSQQSAIAEFVASDEYWIAIAGEDPRRFVESLYGDLLGRAGSTDEVDGWMWTTNVFDRNGRKTLALEFLVSDEYRARAIEAAYQRYLHRAADEGGKAAYLDAMTNGLSLEVLAIELVTSEEYRLRCE